MFKATFDATGDYSLLIPAADPTLLTLAAAYITKESALPVDQQVKEPSLATIQALYTQATAGQTSQVGGETSRAQAAEDHRQAIEAAKPKMRDAIKALEVKCSENLAATEAWGLHTRMSGNKVQVLRPKTNGEWETLIGRYVAKETSLPAGERITKPPFGEMETLAKTLSTSRETRDQGTSTRRQGVQTRNTPLTELQDLLQVAAAVLMSRKNCKVTVDLEAWGFKTKARTGATAAGVSEGVGAEAGQTS